MRVRGRKPRKRSRKERDYEGKRKENTEER